MQNVYLNLLVSAGLVRLVLGKGLGLASALITVTMATAFFDQMRHGVLDAIVGLQYIIALAIVLARLWSMRRRVTDVLDEERTAKGWQAAAMLIANATMLTAIIFFLLHLRD